MNEYYTYAYLREDGTPYYIGKGKNDRITDKNHKIYIPSKERRIYLKRNLTEQDAFKHEIYMIAILGRKDLGTGILRNRTDGGDGVSGMVMSEETRKKISKANTKYTTNEERLEADRKSSKKYYQKNKERVSQYYKERYKNVLSKDQEWVEKNRKPKKPKHLHKTNRLWKKWRITFDDGRQLEMTGLSNWCKENGYSDGLIYQVAKGKRTKHKDIVSVEKLSKTP